MGDLAAALPWWLVEVDLLTAVPLIGVYQTLVHHHQDPPNPPTPAPHLKGHVMLSLWRHWCIISTFVYIMISIKTVFLVHNVNKPSAMSSLLLTTFSASIYDLETPHKIRTPCHSGCVTAICKHSLSIHTTCALIFIICTLQIINPVRL